MILLAALAFADPVVPYSPDLPGNAQSPRWSMDGTRLAWEVNYIERQVIELFTAVPGMPGAPRRVVPTARGQSAVTSGFATSGSEVLAHELSWAPPSIGRYVYSSNAAGQDYDLYLDTNSAIAQSNGADGGAAWSPDGTKIAFTSARSGQGDLYLIDTANPTAAPLKLSGDPVASELYASWAPDSRRLVFVGHTPTGDNLYLIDNIDFPGPKAITSWPHTQTRPRFSPDGTMIAFFSNHAVPDRFDLYVMRINGTPTLIASDVELNTNGPAWSPDSKDVIYVKRDPNQFSPVWAAPIAAPNNARVIDTGTVGNGDLDVVKRADGRAWLALAAQGRTGDAVRDFKRIYVMALPALP